MRQRFQPKCQRAGHEQRQARLPSSALNAEELGHAQAGAAAEDSEHKICQTESAAPAEAGNQIGSADTGEKDQNCVHIDLLNVVSAGDGRRMRQSGVDIVKYITMYSNVKCIFSQSS
jgi:hypothetical protein